MHTHKQSFFALSVIAGVIFGWAAVSTTDAQDAENEHRFYCEMIALWKADAAMNVEPAQRRGWPDYDNRRCE